MSKTIDYLQIDCEPSDITYKVLEQIPFDEYMFGVITYEHDYYSDITKLYRDKSRQFLIDKGYLMVVGDIAPDKNSTFEDWWVHPDIVDKNILEKMLNTHQGVKRADEYFLMP